MITEPVSPPPSNPTLSCGGRGRRVKAGRGKFCASYSSPDECPAVGPVFPLEGEGDDKLQAVDEQEEAADDFNDDDDDGDAARVLVVLYSHQGVRTC